ncbi:hypothetical protein EYZ11_006643 [Aspergillus tanneri]|uniref:Uncharacterized protein n=1 Tax=Aspergillus tanneri TaxID=1220188 RepID=A0A4S3JKQ4_9EURO|nr:hypothetical protein EYZ11_006643 [Aspergillus tanneri]
MYSSSRRYEDGVKMNYFHQGLHMVDHVYEHGNCSQTSPVWMDNGRLQKEQASKFKHIVSQRKSKNRGERPPRTDQLSQGLNRGLHARSTEDATSHPATSPTSVRPLLNERNGALAHDELFDMFLSSFVDAAWSGPSHDDTLTTEPPSYAHPEAPVPVPALFKNIESGPDSSSPGSSEGTLWMPHNELGVREPNTVPGDVVLQEDIRFATNGRTLSDVDELTWSTSQNTNTFPKDAVFNDYMALKPPTQKRAVAPHCHGQSIHWAVAPRESPQSGGAEDALFMHYLDRVFYIQFPFYLSRDRRGRGWLFSILRRVKPAYYATLALSERDLLSTHPQNTDIPSSLARLRSTDGYYYLAAQGTQRIIEGSYSWNGCSHLAHNLEGLTSILQLLFWEVCGRHLFLDPLLTLPTFKLFAGGTRNWQPLLRAAAGLIPELVQARMSLAGADANYANDQQYRRTLSPEDDCATNVLLGSFISFDIISSASTRRTPFLDIDHGQALSNLGISLESITGCRNAIMALIYEISALDRWKEESQAAHRLSIIDLAERGRQIEERLRQELADMDDMPLTGPSLWNHSGIQTAPSNHEISKLFALSAVIYLHVVISGAHPELPEIAEAVSQTVVVFKGLRDRRLLQSILVWPFCISGCLAVGEQQSFFRDLFSAAGIKESTIGTCFEAFQIMEECWEARKTRSYNCDWVSIMKQRGYYVLLR